MPAIIFDVLSGLLRLYQEGKARARQTGALTPEQDAALKAQEAEVYGLADLPAPPPPPDSDSDPAEEA